MKKLLALQVKYEETTGLIEDLITENNHTSQTQRREEYKLQKAYEI